MRKEWTRTQTRTRPAGATAAMAATLFVAAALAPTRARAGGLYAGDNGSQAMQRAGAFVAKADDPTALYFNPAGLLKADGLQVFLGLNLLSYDLSFDREGTYSPPESGSPPSYVGAEYPKIENDAGPELVPFVAGSYRWDERIALGFGLFAPHGYARREFPETVPVGSAVDPAPAPQRYDIVSQRPIVAFPSVAGAYRVSDRLDVGARVSWGFATIEAKSYVWGVFNEVEDVENDGSFEIDASDSFVFNFGVGATYRLTEFLELGLAYVGPVVVDAKGDSTAALGEKLQMPIPGQEDYLEPVPDAQAQCAPGGTLAVLRGCIRFELPMHATASARFVSREGGFERGDVELSVRWENWSAAKDIRVIVDGQDHLTGSRLQPSVLRHGFQDTIGVKLGGQYRFDVGASALLLRAGVAYDTAAAPKSWTRVDLDGKERFTLAGGVGFQTGRLRFDVGGGYVWEPTREVGVVPVADPDEVDSHVQPNPILPLLDESQQFYHPINVGTHESRYLIGSVGLTTWF